MTKRGYGCHGSREYCSTAADEGKRPDAEEGDEGRVAAPGGAGPVVRPEPLGPAPDGRAHLNGRMVCGVTAPGGREGESDGMSGDRPGPPHGPFDEALAHVPDDSVRPAGGCPFPGDGPGELG